MWRYVKESVRLKILARELSDGFIELALAAPDSTKTGRRNRFVAEKVAVRPGLGRMLIRVVYEEIGGEKVVVTAYWARPERYLNG